MSLTLWSLHSQHVKFGSEDEAVFRINREVLIASLEFRLPLGCDITLVEIVTDCIVHLIIQLSVDDEEYTSG